jgi:hypothetical protein
VTPTAYGGGRLISLWLQIYAREALGAIQLEFFQLTAVWFVTLTNRKEAKKATY